MAVRILDRMAYIFVKHAAEIIIFLINCQPRGFFGNSGKRRLFTFGKYVFLISFKWDLGLKDFFSL